MIQEWRDWRSTATASCYPVRRWSKCTTVTQFKNTVQLNYFQSAVNSSVYPFPSKSFEQVLHGSSGGQTLSGNLYFLLTHLVICIFVIIKCFTFLFKINLFIYWHYMAQHESSRPISKQAYSIGYVTVGRQRLGATVSMPPFRHSPFGRQDYSALGRLGAMLCDWRVTKINLHIDGVKIVIISKLANTILLVL